VWDDQAYTNSLHKSRCNYRFLQANSNLSDRYRQETSPEESARGTDHFARLVKKMNAEIKKLENEANRIGSQRQKAQGERKAELAVIESTKE
jgi:hypothetical protein